jgi:hypothetical protein
MFQSSGEQSETPTLLGPLERANLNLWSSDCGLASWTRTVTEFLCHHNSLKPSIKFAMEAESGSAIPVLDILVIRKGTTLATRDYRKPMHTY